MDQKPSLPLKAQTTKSQPTGTNKPWTSNKLLIFILPAMYLFSLE